jgi:hypothetical protein
MILVRNNFRVKFGKAKEAIDLWKEGIEIGKRAGFGEAGARILTDLAGPEFYTVVIEFTHESLADLEKSSKSVMGNAQWQAWYAKIQPLLEGGRREIFNIVA